MKKIVLLLFILFFNACGYCFKTVPYYRHENDVLTHSQKSKFLRLSRGQYSICVPSIKKTISYVIRQDLINNGNDTVYYIPPKSIKYLGLEFQFVANFIEVMPKTREKSFPDINMLKVDTIKITPTNLDIHDYIFSYTAYQIKFTNNKEKRKYKRNIKYTIRHDSLNLNNLSFESIIFIKKNNQVLPLDTIKYRQFTFPR